MAFGGLCSCMFSTIKIYAICMLLGVRVFNSRSGSVLFCKKRWHFLYDVSVINIYAENICYVQENTRLGCWLDRGIEGQCPSFLL